METVLNNHPLNEVFLKDSNIVYRSMTDWALYKFRALLHGSYSRTCTQDASVLTSWIVWLAMVIWYLYHATTCTITYRNMACTKPFFSQMYVKQYKNLHKFLKSKCKIMLTSDGLELTTMQSIYTCALREQYYILSQIYMLIMMKHIKRPCPVFSTPVEVSCITLELSMGTTELTLRCPEDNSGWHGSIALTVPGLCLEVVCGLRCKVADGSRQPVPQYPFHHPVPVSLGSVCCVEHQVAWPGEKQAANLL